jgi:putative NADH-flavin reductase
MIFALYALALSLALWRAGFRGRISAARPVTPAQPTRILIVGATGGTGRHLVTQALERGLRVTVLARKPAKVGLEHPHLTVIKGDVLDGAAVEAAVRGQDAVVSALGHKRFFGPTRILSQGTQNILAAMKTQGVRRLVVETSLGIGDSAGRMGLYFTFFTIPVILPFYFWDKTRQERLIAASGLDWTIVRPVVLTNGRARGQVRLGPGVAGYIWTFRIPRADVATFMLDSLSSAGHVHSAPGIR